MLKMNECTRKCVQSDNRAFMFFFSNSFHKMDGLKKKKMFRTDFESYFSS